MADEEYEKAKKKAEEILGKPIPKITIPEPMPETEEQWWEFIEYYGSVQWRINHDLADNRPWASVEALTEVGETLTFWAAHVAEKYNLILPEACPPANRGVRAGGEISDLVRSFLKIDAKTVPYPPEGKKWWWDWYNETKERMEGRPAPKPREIDPNDPGNRKLRMGG
jgi:hypothetical protein